MGGSLVEAAFWLPSSPVGMKQASEAPGIALHTPRTPPHPPPNYPIREENCLTGHMKEHVGSEEDKSAGTEVGDKHHESACV